MPNLSFFFQWLESVFVPKLESTGCCIIIILFLEAISFDCKVPLVLWASVLLLLKSILCCLALNRTVIETVYGIINWAFKVVYWPCGFQPILFVSEVESEAWSLLQQLRLRLQQGHFKWGWKGQWDPQQWSYNFSVYCLERKYKSKRHFILGTKNNGGKIYIDTGYREEEGCIVHSALGLSKY